MARAGDPVRGSVGFVVRVLELGTAPVRELTRLGSNSLLTALLAALGGPGRDEEDDELAAGPGLAEEVGPSQAEWITRGLLAGRGQYTRLQVAEKAGLSSEQARRLWQALGFAVVDGDEPMFTSADVSALTDVAGLIDAGVVDADGAVELARPLGHLLSRLATAQTGVVTEVLGQRLAAGHLPEDPLLPERVAAQAVAITRELLPVLERTTVYVWRRHLATEVGRALLPVAADTEGAADSRPLAVGFVDISGFTRLSQGLAVAELAVLLERFDTLVLDTVVAYGGRVIKNLGDEVLFVTAAPEPAAEIALSLLEHVEADDRLPPVHVGLAFGPVLSRGGDVFGPVVNIAARVASLARRGTIRVDETMADALDGAEQFDLSLRAPRHVRGYLQLRSHRLRRARPVARPT